MPFAQSSLVFSALCLFVPLSLAVNLLNFFWMDTVFTIAALLTLFLSWRNGETKKTFCLDNKLLLTLLCTYFGAGILGYFLNSPMQANEWSKIAGLRWIFGFFSCCAVGSILAKYPRRINWHFLALISVFIAVVVNHFNLTSGEFFTPDIRLKGFYSNPNYFALAAVLVWSMLLAFIISTKSCAARTSAVFALALTTTTLIATYTRTSWIGMIASLCVALLYSRNKKATAVSLIALASFSIAVALNLFELKDRILYSFDFSGSNSQMARFAVWKASWHLFLDHPAFGVGFENAAKLFPEYYIKSGHPNEYVVGHAHNQFLEILAGSGLFGLAGYLGLFGCGLAFFHNRFISAKQIFHKQLSLASILCIVALFACSWTETPFIQHEVRNYVMIILGFSYGYLKTIKPDEVNRSPE